MRGFEPTLQREKRERLLGTMEALGVIAVAAFVIATLIVYL